MSTTIATAAINLPRYALHARLLRGYPHPLRPTTTSSGAVQPVIDPGGESRPPRLRSTHGDNRRIMHLCGARDETVYALLSRQPSPPAPLAITLLALALPLSKSAVSSVAQQSFGTISPKSQLLGVQIVFSRRRALKPTNSAASKGKSLRKQEA